ncbi:MAG TPA: aminotransferase class V-fold PLP-dependent enzyme, partial [Gemmatimonadales bacterium]|nr:aminotransferase class V-fold PLP-dependent enzyme [Gemmatimonadales bacterium]
PPGASVSDLVSDAVAAPAGRFFLPGPTEVRPAVLAAMLRPMMPHRGRAFEALFERLQAGLRAVFRTTRPVLVSTSSATGLMEAAVRCAPAGPVLALVNGAFAERFAQLARACDRETDVLETPWGAAPDLDAVARRLAARRYAAVTVVHSETSTGVLTDVRAVTALARHHGARCLVDSVTGIAGAPLEFDAWELDFALTGSQKALALPPGLAFAAASADFMDAVRRDAPAGRGLYFDLVEMEAFAARHQTPNTPALPLLYALEAQLAAIAAEGIEARWRRHAAMAETVVRWVETAGGPRAGLGILAPPGARSPTVTALTLPPTLTGDAVVAAMAERGYTIGNGYGKLKGASVRIGHMGDHTVAGLAGCLDALADVLPSSPPAG